MACNPLLTRRVTMRTAIFVPRSHRQQGVTRALLEGAVAYAKKLGARVVEGYPFDTAGITATHRGHSSVFEAVRFRPNGSRWVRHITSRGRLVSNRRDGRGGNHPQ